jgi:raffinose/stachyose/melibiose transport system permease protein
MKKSTLNRHNNWELLLFCLPAVLLVCLFFYYPLMSGINIAFFSWNGISNNAKLVGLKNFIDLFQDASFLNSLFFSLLYTTVNLVFVNLFAIFLASLLSGRLKTGGLLRTLFFAPNIVSLVVTGMIWLFIFSTAYQGVVKMINIPALNIDWFGSEEFARLALFIVAGWVTTGYLMVIYLAGLKSIDTEILEAAAMDGCSGIILFFKVKLPLLMPSVVICVFWITLYSLKIFDLPMVMTAGAPYRSTETMPLNIYYSAFTYNQYGYASAKSLVLLAIILMITMVEVFYLKRNTLKMASILKKFLCSKMSL